MKKIIMICASIITVFIITTGCSNSLKAENIKLAKEVGLMKEKNIKLEKLYDELMEENKSLNAKLKKVEAKNLLISEKMTKYKDSIYPIYSANVDTYEKEVYFVTYIPKNLPLKNKLDALAKTLSEIYFGDLPIEVSEITEVNGKRIATINLKESMENQKILDTLQFKGQSWIKNYFQGSTGGNITTVCLTETFLQKEYDEQWIDGVKFLYNNKIINLDHVPELSQVSYRK